jgi:hypothetical protein
MWSMQKKKKKNEILCHFSKIPDVLCITEHHLSSLEIQSVLISVESKY